MKHVYKSEKIEPLYKKMEKALELMKTIPEASTNEERPMTRAEQKKFDSAYKKYTQLSAKVQAILAS